MVPVCFGLAVRCPLLINIYYLCAFAYEKKILMKHDRKNKFTYIFFLNFLVLFILLLFFFLLSCVFDYPNGA